MFLATYIVDLPFATATNFYPIYWSWIEQGGDILEKAGAECDKDIQHRLFYENPFTLKPIFLMHVLKYAYVFKLNAPFLL